MALRAALAARKNKKIKNKKSKLRIKKKNPEKTNS
jgi:hypothetical protein